MSVPSGRRCRCPRSRLGNTGANVSRVDFYEAIRINEVRGVLESFIAGRAAVAAVPSDHAELSGLIDDMRIALANDDLVDYSCLSAALHRRVREIGGHAIATELVDHLRDRAISHEIRLSLLRGRTEESIVQHTDIVAAIVAGDAGRAEAAMRARLDSVALALHRAACEPGRFR